MLVGKYAIGTVKVFMGVSKVKAHAFGDYFRGFGISLTVYQ